MSFSMNSSVTFDIHGKLVGDRQQFSVDFRTTFSAGILLTLLFDEEHSSLQVRLCKRLCALRSEKFIRDQI